MWGTRSRWAVEGEDARERGDRAQDFSCVLRREGDGALEVEGRGHKEDCMAGEYTAAMELTLPPELEQRIQRQLQSGRFNSAVELVSTALDAIESFPLPQGMQQADFERLLEEGCDAADRGDTVSAEEAREHLARVRAKL
jgi:Arc/MetJ-type ribon-helix-helix transcriptional regulator